MSDKTPATKQAAEDQYRALIVRKLRAEADRIEAGGSPNCYATMLDDDVLRTEADLGIIEARKAPNFEIEDDDQWSEFVEGQEWGVVVSVECAVRTSHRADLSDRFSHIVNYRLADPDTAPEPEVLPQYCPVCEDEVWVEPDGVCPTCAAAEDDEGCEGGVGE